MKERIVFAVLMASTGALGCGGGNNAEPKTPSDVAPAPSATASAATAEAPPPAPAAPPSRWKRYTSAEGGFDVLLPCDAPQEEVKEGGAPSAGFTFESHIVSCPRATPQEAMYGVEFWTKTKIPGAMDAELATDPQGGTRDQAFARFYASSVQAQMQGQGLKASLSPLAAKGGFEGQELHVESSSQNRIHQRIWVKLPRCITLSVINEEMGNDAENGAFLESLAIH